MNAALCFAEENHGSRQLGAQAAPAADVHLSVPPIWALPLLWGSRPHDSVRLSVRRGDVLLFTQPLTNSEFVLYNLLTSVFLPTCPLSAQ